VGWTAFCVSKLLLRIDKIHYDIGGRWIRTFDSWSRDRQTVMGGGPAFETGADLSGNRRFESITLHQRVRYETFPATPADRRVDQEAAITPGLHQLTSARRAAPSPPPNRRCTKIVGMPSSLVIAIGGDHHHRQIGEAMFDLAQQLTPSMPSMLMPERMTISCGSISPASRSSAASP
jgi:hypothetical protein